MELHHIELEKNRIYISQTVMTNKRYLTLHPIQKRELTAYLHQERNELLNTYYHTSTSRLFFSTRSKNSLTDVHNQMLKRMKKIYPYLISFKQIRSSRIAIWVSQHGIRKAQYMSGLKNVTSLIRYRQADKEKLKQKLDVVHPMERLNL